MSKRDTKSRCEEHPRVSGRRRPPNSNRLTEGTRSDSPHSNMTDRQSAKLVIDADCTTCGPIASGVSDGISIVRTAMAHSAATKHVVVLNGTTDVPEIDEPFQFS